MATARGSNWSREEVAAAVADYFRMLALELEGQPYNKAAHNRALQKLLGGRTHAAVELKHQNISAILIELGCYYIPGYKPMDNYQELLWNAVAARLKSDKDFDRIARLSVEREAVAPMRGSWEAVLVEPPRLNRVSDSSRLAPEVRRGVHRDYLEREARNQVLGRAGEEFVAEFESRRLHAGGHRDLAERVEHISTTRGDGLGYDVLSFDPSGQERLSR
jgi:hypothetical protein